MKKQVKSPLQKGFTLIELIIVIAILSFVAVAAIKGYANIREIQAKKVNLANIKRVAHSLSTYEAIHSEGGTTGYFNYFDSICDADPAGPNGQQMGDPGTAKWCAVSGSEALKSKTPGIYDGSWKYLLEVRNRANVLVSAAPSYESARNQNLGTTTTGLADQLGVYYLTANEATALKRGGINYILYHNASTGQSGAFVTSYTNFADGVSFGGGPGFRPDMSACYPGIIQEGAAVAMIIPGSVAGETQNYVSKSDGSTIETSAYKGLTEEEKGNYNANTKYSFTGSSIYSDLGYPIASQSTTGTNITTVADFATKVTTKLFAFGIGRSAECVRNKIGIGEAPVNAFYDKKNYRQYIAVFAYQPGGQGVAATCHFVGCLDCAGNTYKAAEYSVNWTTELN